MFVLVRRLQAGMASTTEDTFGVQDLALSVCNKTNRRQ